MNDKQIRKYDKFVESKLNKKTFLFV